MGEERVYVIPLRDAWNSAYHKRAKKAIRIIKEFAVKHMKVEKVKISTNVNHKIWERGNSRPPRKIKVVIKKDGEEAIIDLFVEKDNKIKEEDKQTQDERQEEQDNKLEKNTKENKEETKKENNTRTKDGEDSKNEDNIKEKEKENKA